MINGSFEIETGIKIASGSTQNKRFLAFALPVYKPFRIPVKNAFFTTRKKILYLIINDIYNHLKSSTTMANQPIPITEANDMIQQYLTYMTSLKVDMGKQTHSVSFTSADLLKWVDEVKIYTDEFRICLGVYPAGGISPGRITAIVWPYKNGKPATKPDAGKSGGGSTGIKPYNQGGGNP
jgi:hypothetical protein